MLMAFLVRPAQRLCSHVALLPLYSTASSPAFFSVASLIPSSHREQTLTLFHLSPSLLHDRVTDKEAANLRRYEILSSGSSKAALSIIWSYSLSNQLFSEQTLFCHVSLQLSFTHLAVEICLAHRILHASSGMVVAELAIAIVAVDSTVLHQVFLP